MTLPVTGPRAVRWREGFRASVILLEIATVAVLLGGSWWADASTAEQIEFELRRVPVEGKVIGYRSSLRYEFWVDGKRWRGETPVSHTRRLTTPIGAPVTVYYLPRNPSISTIEAVTPGRGEEDRRLAKTSAIGIGLALGLVVVALRLAARRQRTILRDWQAIPAKVLDRREYARSASGYFSVEIEVHGSETRQIHRVIGTEAAIGLLPGVETSLLIHPRYANTYLLPGELRFVEPITEAD